MDEEFNKTTPESAPALTALVEEGKRTRKEKEGICPDNVKAFSLFCEAALAGNAEAQYLVSSCYRQGCGVSKDDERSLAWLKMSAEHAFPNALVVLGLLQRRDGNEEEAIKYFEKAAGAGMSAACAVLVSTYRERGDAANALKWLKQEALLGDPEALWSVRVCYERREDVDFDLQEGYAWLSLFEDRFTTRKNSEELACFHLDPESSKYKTTSLDLKMLMSASQIDEGTQRYQDLVKQRIIIIRKKAEQNDSDAQYELGWCYYDGYGVAQNRTESVKWWRLAAEHNHGRAQNAVGHCYKYSEGVEQNHSEAINFFRRAAAQDHRTAQYSLGHSLCMGLGAPQDYVEGGEWIRKSAEAGNAVAIYSLGFLYEHGYGVSQDRAEAMRWYLKAAEKGDVEARERIETLQRPVQTD